MSVITFSDAYGVSMFTWGLMRRDISYNSAFGSQAVGISGPVWVATLAQVNEPETVAGAWQALALKLSGKVDQLELWNLKRPEPIGTMRGTMTVKGAHAQGATSLIISAGAGQAGTTLKAGDYLGLGAATTQQIVMALANATADGAGDITIDISATPLRNAFSNGAAVAWSKPKALFRQSASKAVWNYPNGGICSGIAFDLIEDWRS